MTDHAFVSMLLAPQVDGVLGPQTEARLEMASVHNETGHNERGTSQKTTCRSVFTSRAAGDAVVVSWDFDEVTKLCAEHPELQQELRRAFSHSATVKALGLARQHAGVS